MQSWISVTNALQACLNKACGDIANDKRF